MFPSLLHTVKLQFHSIVAEEKKKSVFNERVFRMGNSGGVMNKSSWSEKWEKSDMQRLFSVIIITRAIRLCFFPFQRFTPSDETEYEYSGSEEEDEERDMGEPRLVFLTNAPAFF